MPDESAIAAPGVTLLAPSAVGARTVRHGDAGRTRSRFKRTTVEPPRRGQRRGGSDPGAGHARAAPGVLAPPTPEPGVTEMVGIVKTFQASERRIVELAGCPHCGATNVFRGFTVVDAFVCEECGEGVNVEWPVQ